MPLDPEGWKAGPVLLRQLLEAFLALSQIEPLRDQLVDYVVTKDIEQLAWVFISEPSPSYVKPERGTRNVVS
jgi:hypothetical protein